MKKRHQIQQAPLYEQLGGDDDAGRRIQLDVLEPPQHFSVDKFLGLLNNPDRQEANSAVQAAAVPKIEFPKPTPVHVTLRTWIDQWLNSGRGRSGDEYPHRRTFKRAPEVADAAYQFSKSGKFVLLPSGNALIPWLARLDESGVTLRGRWWGLLNEAEAKEYLVLFLLSEVRFLLAKCRNQECGKYFLLKQRNRTYKGGTICPNCNGALRDATSIALTKANRKEAAKTLHQMAARQFAGKIKGNSLWHKQEPLKSDVAKYLSRLIKGDEPLETVYKNGITTKWVARSENWSAIERLARRKAQ